MEGSALELVVLAGAEVNDLLPRERQMGATASTFRRGERSRPDSLRSSTSLAAWSSVSRTRRAPPLRSEPATRLFRRMVRRHQRARLKRSSPSSDVPDRFMWQTDTTCPAPPMVRLAVPLEHSQA